MKHFFIPLLWLGLLTGLPGSAVGQALTLKERFQAADQNGDGKVTPKELARPALFKRLDKNDDGVVTIDELSVGQLTQTGDQSDDSKITRQVDLSYGKHASQKLDLYRPAEADQLPVMVYVHGGGWRKGDKRAVGEKAKFFCGNGWVFLSINYRLLPAGKHPANVQDVAKALAWVHDKIAKHGGDPSKIFLMGHSAGAHLVALVSTDQRHLKSFDKELSILKGVIPLDTNTYDIPKLMEGRSTGSYEIVFGNDPATWRDAAPISHVAADKNIPPFLICYSRGLGNFRNPLRAEQANAFARRLVDVGIAAEVVDASDRNHGEINARFGKSDDPKVTGKAKAFLEAILADDPPAQSRDHRSQDSTGK